MRKRTGTEGWLRGKTEVGISGAEPWLFLNRCAAAGISFSRAKAENACSLRLFLYPGDMERAARLALRCGCTLERGAPAGLPALSRKLRRRLFLSLGALAVAGALLFSSLFIWDISVTENDSTLSEREILAALREDGVGIGTFAPTIREDAVRSKALERLPELSWLAVNVSGSRASVEVRAATEKPEIWEVHTPMDIVAERTGVIAELTVMEGECLVRRGDVVTEGQLLISSERSAARGGRRKVHARADIKAYTWRELTVSAPLVVAEKRYTGRERRHFSVILGKRRINFYGNTGILPSGCDKMTETGSFGREDVFTLPAAWVRETLRPYTINMRELDAEELRPALEAELAKRLAEELGERGEVRTMHYSASVSDGRLRVTLRAECLERIDRESPAE